jgi:predicted GIY-YIG superfamily endonuclease
MPTVSLTHLSPQAAIKDDPWPRIARRLSGEIPYVYANVPDWHAEEWHNSWSMYWSYDGHKLDYKLDNDQWSVYILLLTGDKFYVGITRHMWDRWCDHLLGSSRRGKRKGAIWTEKYQPLAVIRTMIVIGEEEALRHENDTTIWLMHKYGVNNVRGGPYWTLEDIPLPDFSKISNY